MDSQARVPQTVIYFLFRQGQRLMTEAFGRMAEHFCRTTYGLAEGLDSKVENF